MSRQRQYFVLESQPSTLVAHLVNSSGEGFGLEFLQGTWLTYATVDHDLHIEIEGPVEPLPDYFEVDCVPIVNQSFMQAFQSSGCDNFQLYPLPLHFSDQEVQGYAALNVLGRIACLDLNESQYTEFRGKVFRIQSLAMRPTDDTWAPVFRAHEYQEVVFVDERVQEALAANSISGLRITPAEQWNDAHRF